MALLATYEPKTSGHLGLKLCSFNQHTATLTGKRLLFAAEAVKFVEFSFVCGRLEASLLALVETLNASSGAGQPAKFHASDMPSSAQQAAWLSLTPGMP